MRFLELLEDVKSFLSERGDSHPQFTNKEWLLSLSFLADFSSKLNVLNLELQGKDRNLLDMISSIRAFQQLIILLKANLKDKKFKHFPSIQKYIQTYAELAQFNPNKMILEIEIVKKQFQTRFQDFGKIENIVLFFSNVFQQDINIEEITSQISTIFEANHDKVKLEIIKFENDMYLNSKNCIWKYTKEKYPILTNAAQKFMSCFGSTYLAESAFSDMNILKSKIRNSLNDEHVDQCLRLSLSSYDPAFENIAKSMQCQRSI